MSKEYFNISFTFTYENYMYLKLEKFLTCSAEAAVTTEYQSYQAWRARCDTLWRGSGLKLEPAA